MGKGDATMQAMKLFTMTAVIAAGLGLSACETNKGTGAVAGAAGGAAMAGMTGGNRAAGAAIGGAGGAIVGSAVDRDVNSGKCFQRGVEVACPPQ
jgi:hypothetical protein